MNDGSGNALDLISSLAFFQLVFNYSIFSRLWCPPHYQVLASTSVSNCQGCQCLSSLRQVAGPARGSPTPPSPSGSSEHEHNCHQPACQGSLFHAKNSLAGVTISWQVCSICHMYHRKHSLCRGDSLVPDSFARSQNKCISLSEYRTFVHSTRQQVHSTTESSKFTGVGPSKHQDSCSV